LNPRIFINPEVDTLVFSEERGGEFNEVFTQNETTYWDYFKHMTKNMNPSLLTTLRQIGISDQAYLGNIHWDLEREDVFNLTKFTNLKMAAIVVDASKKMVGPVKLAQLTWGECPVRECSGTSTLVTMFKSPRKILLFIPPEGNMLTSLSGPLDTAVGRSKPDYDGHEVLHCCNLCYCPFIQEITLQLRIDHVYFEQLRRGIGAMFSEFEKRKLPGWKVPKTKSMVMLEKDRNVKKGSRELYFRKPMPSICESRTPDCASITKDGKRIVSMDPSCHQSGCF
jgi:hypothetical protein